MDNHHGRVALLPTPNERALMAQIDQIKSIMGYEIQLLASTIAILLAERECKSVLITAANKVGGTLHKDVHELGVTFTFIPTPKDSGH